MKLETQCPKCDFKLGENQAIVNDENQLVCGSCGHTGKLDDFLTAETIARINKAAQEAAIKAFSKIPGFKK